MWCAYQFALTTLEAPDFEIPLQPHDTRLKQMGIIPSTSHFTREGDHLISILLSSL